MDNKEAGFTFLEILLALALSAILLLFLWTFSSQASKFWQLEIKGVDDYQQGRYVLETISQGIREAKRDTLEFLDLNEDCTYRRIEFSPRHNPQALWAYYSKEGNILKAVKNPGQTKFTGLSLALGVQDLYFVPREDGEKFIVEVVLVLKTKEKSLPLTLGTLVSPRL